MNLDNSELFGRMMEASRNRNAALGILEAIRKDPKVALIRSSWSLYLNSIVETEEKTIQSCYHLINQENDKE